MNAGKLCPCSKKPPSMKVKNAVSSKKMTMKTYATGEAKYLLRDLTRVWRWFLYWPRHSFRFPPLLAVSGMVMVRNTSSKRPSSVCNSSILQPCAASAILCAKAPPGALLTPPLFGNTRAGHAGVACFLDNDRLLHGRKLRKFLIQCGAPSTPVTRIVTAPAHSDFCRNCCGVPLATILPRAITIAREQTASTSSKIWVEKMIAFFHPFSGSACGLHAFDLDRNRPSVHPKSGTSGSWMIDCAKQVRCR